MITFLLVVWLVSSGSTIKMTGHFNTLNACQEVIQSFRRQAHPIRKPKVIFINGGGLGLYYIGCKEILK